MKKITSKFISIIVFTIFFSSAIFADQPPDPGGDPTGGDPVGGGSPVGSGLFMLIALGAAYGSKKVYNARNKILK